MAGEIYKILIFLKRRPGMSREDFQTYYETQHAPLCLKYTPPGVSRYFRRYVQPMTDPATGEPIEMDFDVVTELWFHDKAAYEGALHYAGRGILPQDVIEDEEKLFDRPKARFTTIVERETDLVAAGIA
ncbi:MAG: EthD domain-containing protein [Sphingobium sp.]